MEVKLFNRGVHEESLRKLRVRKAPGYVIEAYLHGHTKVVNEYYKERYSKRLGRAEVLSESKQQEIILVATQDVTRGYIQEALAKRDLDFLKAFYQMTNADIFSGSKLPPNVGELIKQGTTKNLNVKDIIKKLK